VTVSMERERLDLGIAERDVRSRPKLGLRRAHLLVLIWMSVTWLIGLPSAFRAPDTTLDGSWELGLHLAFASHFQWGTQIVWTYGPYGFLAQPVYVTFETWLLALVASLLLHAVFVGIVAAMLLRLRARWFCWALVGGILLVPVWHFLSLEYVVALSGVVALWLTIDLDNRLAALGTAVVAGSLLGLLPLIKGTGIIMAAIMLAGFSLGAFLARGPRRLLVAVGTAVVAFCVLWWAAGQHLSGVVPYFESSYQLISGYSAAMSLGSEVPQHYTRRQVAFGLFVVVSSALAWAWVLLRRDRRLGTLLTFATPLTFLLFKEGFVRFDGHQLYFYAVVDIIEVLILAVAWGTGRTVGLPVAVQAAIVGLVTTSMVAWWLRGELRWQTQWIG
jgi:hypothetical protein